MQNYVILEKSTGVQVFLAVAPWILTRQVANFFFKHVPMARSSGIKKFQNCLIKIHRVTAKKTCRR